MGTTTLVKNNKLIVEKSANGHIWVTALDVNGNPVPHTCKRIKKSEYQEQNFK